jgi:hypothetical protein
MFTIRNELATLELFASAEMSEYARILDETGSDVALLANELQPKIKSMLTGFGATEVHFVDGNFIIEAAAKGSLHCLAKVSRRDFVLQE